MHITELEAIVDAAKGDSFAKPAYGVMRTKGLICERYTESGNLAGWQLTEKGHVWLDYVLSTPLPVQVWSMNGGDK